MVRTIGDTIYDLFMHPLEHMRLGKKRAYLFEDVAGDVLEIGYGTGVNLKYYPYEQMDSLSLLDTNIPNHLSTKSIPMNMPFNVDRGSVQNLPYEDESFDSVVFTLVFCSVEDPAKGLNEVYRVLKPGGRVYFMEHLLPTKPHLKHLFNKLTPVWKRVAHGCHLNRETITLIQQSGLKLQDYHRFFNTAFAVGIAAKE